MTREIIPIEAKNAGTVHILAGTVTDVDIANNKVNVNIDSYGSFSDIPVFYHCEDDRETANGMPFLGDERVIIVNHGSAVNLSVNDMKVIGFEDGLPRECPMETVYVVMKVKGTQRCFVWKVEDGEYATVNKNDGDPASFPCDPADISNWVHDQKSVGDALLRANNCGRNFFGYRELPACDYGDWGTAGNTSDSKQEPSDCEGCEFIDTAECEINWNLATQCQWVPTPEPGYWRYSGSISHHLEQNLLWGRRTGWPREHYGSRALEFRNNSGIKNAFRVEIESNNDKSQWTTEADGMSSGCNNFRLDSFITTQNYKFHTPIAENIFPIIFTETGSCNAYADTGVRKQENFVVPMQLKVYGVYSEKIIAQAYFVEVQTIDRSASCNWIQSMCVGSGCVGNNCPWKSEVYTSHGLKVVAQADVLENTNGIDPTGLPRNNLFEDAINELYNVLRVAESIPSDEIAGARFTGFNILKGV